MLLISWFITWLGVFLPGVTPGKVISLYLSIISGK
jgi:hypothetical protein